MARQAKYPNPTSICEDASLIPGLHQWVKDPALLQAASKTADPVWLWLWCRLAAAALIWPLARELPYATGVALKRKKKKKEIGSSSFPFIVCFGCGHKEAPGPGIRPMPQQWQHQILNQLSHQELHCYAFYVYSPVYEGMVCRNTSYPTSPSVSSRYH